MIFILNKYFISIQDKMDHFRNDSVLLYWLEMEIYLKSQSTKIYLAKRNDTYKGWIFLLKQCLHWPAYIHMTTLAMNHK